MTRLKTEHLCSKIDSRTMHYSLTQNGAKYQSLTTESWPFQYPQTWEESLSFDLFCFHAGAKYAKNDRLLVPLLFILSPSFLSISADALPIFLFRFETLFITRWFGLCFTFSHVFFYLSFCLPITQDVFLPNPLARIHS